MKILAVSLLRMGDLIMMAPALSGLKRKYPGAELHLLVNDAAAPAAELLPCIDHKWVFERQALQWGLGEYRRPIFESYDRLQDLLEQLNAVGFDKVINFTHNTLSGWLVSALAAEVKTGLHFDLNGKVQFSSAWFDHLNSEPQAGEPRFHFTDIYRFACGVDEDSNHFGLCEDVTPFNGAKPHVAVQISTSDEKKTWPLAEWKNALTLFGLMCPHFRLIFLGAPNEHRQLRQLQEHCHAQGLDCATEICDLAGALSVLRSAQLLVTGDTGIKHLAAAAGTPILEISLGSSDMFAVGAYSDRGYILQNRESCSPCTHSSACAREKMFCHDRLTSPVVAGVMKAILESDEAGLQRIAEEGSEDFLIYRTNVSSLGYWTARDMRKNSDDWKLLVAQASLKLRLQKNNQEEGWGIGTHALRIRDILRQKNGGLSVSFLELQDHEQQMVCAAAEIRKTEKKIICETNLSARSFAAAHSARNKLHAQNEQVDLQKRITKFLRESLMER